MRTFSRAPLLALAAALSLAGSGAAQSHGSAADTSLFAPMGLWPSPNEIRTGSGAPGGRPWQNRADYTIPAPLDTAAKTARGEVRPRHTNHSPDSLHFIW